MASPNELPNQLGWCSFCLAEHPPQHTPAVTTAEGSAACFKCNNEWRHRLDSFS